MAPFSWFDSHGWLVLSGYPDVTSEIRANALSRYDGAGAIAYLSLSDDLGDALMDDMAELGAPTGFLVDLRVADNNEIYERLGAASMIVAETARPDQLHLMTTQTVRSALRAALADGALVLFEGLAASVAGARRLNAHGDLVDALGLVEQVLITPSAAGESAPIVHDRQPHLSVLSLAPGSALALGPARQIEAWGAGDLTITLGDITRQTAAL